MNTLKKQRNSFIITLLMLIGAALVFIYVSAGVEWAEAYRLSQYLLMSLSSHLMTGISGGQ